MMGGKSCYKHDVSGKHTLNSLAAVVLIIMETLMWFLLF